MPLYHQSAEIVIWLFIHHFLLSSALAVHPPFPAIISCSPIISCYHQLCTHHFLLSSVLGAHPPFPAIISCTPTISCYYQLLTHHFLLSSAAHPSFPAIISCSPTIFCYHLLCLFTHHFLLSSAQAVHPPFPLLTFFKQFRRRNKINMRNTKFNFLTSHGFSLNNI